MEEPILMNACYVLKMSEYKLDSLLKHIFKLVRVFIYFTPLSFNQYTNNINLTKRETNN